MPEAIRLGPTKGLLRRQAKARIIEKLGEITPDQRADCLREMAGFGLETLTYIWDHGFFGSPNEFISSVQFLQTQMDTSR